MKKLSLILALAGGMFAAQAQSNFQLVLNDADYYNDGDTISLNIYESQVADADYEFHKIMHVKNNTSNTMNVVLYSHTDSPGYEVTSVCSSTCVPGETSPAFEAPAGALSGDVYPGFTLTPSQMNADGVGIAVININDTRDGSALLTCYLRMTYDNPAGIENAQKASVKVYPNPATEMLTISSEDIDQVVLTDLSGKSVLSQRTSGAESQINVSGLAKGMYILNTLKNGQINGTQKVVVR